MKHLHVLTASLALSVLAAAVGHPVAPADSLLRGTEGWAGDSAYRFIQWGFAGPQDAGKSEDARRSRACNAALVGAQFKALERLADAGIESVKGTVSVTVNRGKVMTEVSGFVRGGRVVEAVFNPGEDKCWVVYEINEPGLKKRVLNAVRKNAGK